MTTVSDELRAGIPDVIILLFHDGCSRAHWTFGEMRKCAGNRWVYSDQVVRVAYERRDPSASARADAS
jgi:hypothetical protein